MAVPSVDARQPLTESQGVCDTYDLKKEWTDASLSRREVQLTPTAAAAQLQDSRLEGSGAVERQGLLSGDVESSQPYRMESTASAVDCSLRGFGVIVVLAMHGLLQERIMTTTYNGDYFRSALFLVLCNRVVGVLVAVFMALAEGQPLLPQANLGNYAAVSVLSVVASSCQYEALKWVAFPVQVMGKSCKIIPVMMCGVLIARKKYTVLEWISAGAIFFGISAFTLGGDISPPHDEHNQTWFGLILLGIWIAADSLTLTAQEHLFQMAKTDVSNQLLYTNLFSTALCIGSLALADEGIEPQLMFCRDHPRFILDAAALCCAAVIGRVLVLAMVQMHGAVALATAMSMRQVVSVVMSCMVFKHTLKAMQVCGFVTAFGVLLITNVLKLEMRCCMLPRKQACGMFSSQPQPAQAAELVEVSSGEGTPAVELHMHDMEADQEA
mmetsp:Transcript_45272/g.105035  ORF Transcript_45272/g.105035 Transcript_45272/m.105035 type:complete len:440 (+) Transcript_45272:42-1361(+)